MEEGHPNIILPQTKSINNSLPQGLYLIEFLPQWPNLFKITPFFMRWMFIFFQHKFFKRQLRKIRKRKGTTIWKCCLFWIVFFYISGNSIKYLDHGTRISKIEDTFLRFFIPFSHSVLKFPLLSWPTCWI